LKRIGDVVWSVVGEVLGAQPDQDNPDAKELARPENTAAREQYISITNRLDDLRFDLAEMDAGERETDPLVREELARKIETLIRERRDLADGHSGQEGRR